MPQYRLLLEYDGTDYSGWQLQPNVRTLQGVLETALETALRHRVRIAAAGRTDAGVHAMGQVATFRSDALFVPRDLRASLNALTPRDVVVRDVGVVADDFDPRRHAKARVYEYRIWNQPWPSAFWYRHTWHVARTLDARAMRDAAAVFAGTHDFSAFQAADCEATNPVRRVFHSGLTDGENVLVYRIEATAFLKHMVRAIVGTLARVGGGDLTPDAVSAILASRDRRRAAETAPPQGLVLMAVHYE
jgi:tRNA pseudouridine38-40 synthase